MGKLDGTISITGLPPHRGLIVNVCLFEVGGLDAPAPHDGDPPPEAVADTHKVVEDVHLHEESQRPTFEQTFHIDHRPGFYYVQVRVILFRNHKGSMLAQAEQFFFARRPVQIAAEPAGQITFPVSWPTKSLEELHKYGTIRPQSNDRAKQGAAGGK